MTAVIEFFKGIGNFLVSLADFIISFFQDLIYLIQLLGKVILSIPTYLSWIPSPFIPMLITLFSIVVIYKILGREG